ncbi:hypothetical protein [Novosphingopyxis sp.]|uniref:hypothetical protein n=1 Tax=Novosphingopyxis sp. TaxID=2709690 RepID=UPI003B5989A7
MPKTATVENVIELEPKPVSSKLLVLLGPQNSGKSLLGRAIVERAREQGRDPLILDGDRNDAYLASLFTETDAAGTSARRVRRPDYADDTTVKAWLDAEVSEMEGDGRSRVLDMGGGDLVFPDYAREREIVAMLADARAAIDPVAIHLILPTVSDLAVLERTEGDGLFTPAATILALNAGPVGDTRPAEVVFRRVRGNPIYRSAIARGAREIVVPTLGCMNLVDDAGLSFEQAMARSSPLGLAHRQMVATFRRRLHAELERVSPWLP